MHILSLKLIIWSFETPFCFYMLCDRVKRKQKKESQKRVYWCCTACNFTINAAILLISDYYSAWNSLHFFFHYFPLFFLFLLIFLFFSSNEDFISVLETLQDDVEARITLASLLVEEGKENEAISLLSPPKDSGTGKNVFFLSDWSSSMETLMLRYLQTLVKHILKSQIDGGLMWE